MAKKKIDAVTKDQALQRIQMRRNSAANVKKLQPGVSPVNDYKQLQAVERMREQ